jgi:Protein of unknown function (DUF2802)
MGLLIFLQVILDLAFIATATFLFMERFKSKTMEDPRLSRGLQLLSSKIAILQDLMDRSDSMGQQMSRLMDGKQQDIQERLEEAEVHLHKIRKATEKSQAVAEIFQERIPHQEIIERQTTAKYLQAAKMAHQGFAIEDIAKQVDIPQGELELIVKVNRDRLIATEPVWAQTTQEEGTSDLVKAVEATLKAKSEDEVPAAVASAVNAAAVSAFAADFDEEVPVEKKNNMARVLNSANPNEVQVRPVVFERIT